MPLAEAIGSAVGGLFQAGANLYMGHKQLEADKKMNADNLRLAYIQRDDQLRQNAADNEYRTKQSAFDRKLALQDRAFRDREAAYQRLQDGRAAARQRLQDDMGFRNNIISMVNASRRR